MLAALSINITALVARQGSQHARCTSPKLKGAWKEYSSQQATIPLGFGLHPFMS